jgi:hypothetical protein
VIIDACVHCTRPPPLLYTPDALVIFKTCHVYCGISQCANHHFVGSKAEQQQYPYHVTKATSADRLHVLLLERRCLKTCQQVIRGSQSTPAYTPSREAMLGCCAC